MSKKKSITLLSIIIAVILILSAMTFAKFEIPGIKNGVYNYNSILGALELDADFTESASYTLKLKDGVSSEDEEIEVSSVLKVLENRIIGLGYTNYKLSTLKSSSSDNYDIRIEMPNTSATAGDIGAIITYGVIEITDGDGNLIATGNEAIKNATVQSFDAMDQAGNEVIAYAVIVEFTNAGYDAIVDRITSGGHDHAEGEEHDHSGDSLALKIKLGDTELFSQEVTVDALSAKTISINNYGTDKAAANRAALQIKTGGFPYEYELEEGVVVNPLMGNKAALTVMITVASLILLALVLFAIKYRGFAISSLISILSFILIELIVLVLIPGIKISLASILGFAVATLFVCIGLYVLTQKTYVEFNGGKTFKAALRNAYKKGSLLFVDISAILAILSLAVFFIANGVAKSFVITFGVGVVVALFIIVVFSKWIVKLLYQAISKKEAFFNLNREDAE
ncbi:MAG: hypothetical protein E7342_00505 [Clostridiales bacterium]|nr:hypothetical protein [Clostridiales bacterium]